MRNNKQVEPAGELRADFDQLHAAGCIQTGADVHKDLAVAKEQFARIFELLVRETAGNLCKGCPALDGGCEAHRRYFKPEVTKERLKKDATKPPGTKDHPGKSVATIAAELGISKNEVRRRKVAGLL